MAQITAVRTTKGNRSKPNHRICLVVVLALSVLVVSWSQRNNLPSTEEDNINHTPKIRAATATSNLVRTVNKPRKGNFIYTPHTDPKLEPTNCSNLLDKYRIGQISQTNQASKSYPIDKSYVTRSNTQYAFQVSVHDEKVDGMRYAIFNSGDYYETVMSDVIADIFNKADANTQQPVMLDVGANVGWFALLAASHGAEVFAFEPNVINIVRFCESQLLNGWSLAQNVEGNNRIHTYMAGVGNQHGQSLSMYKPDPNNPGSFTFNQELAKDHFAKRKAGGELEQLDGGALPIVTLDALAKDQGWLSDESSKVKIDLMKIDVEGMEHIALEGAKELLQSNIIENILMEINADASRSDLVAQVRTLFECGYRLYKIGGHLGPNKEFNLSIDDPEVVIDDIKNRDFGIAGSNANVWFKVKTKGEARK